MSTLKKIRKKILILFMVLLNNMFINSNAESELLVNSWISLERNSYTSRTGSATVTIDGKIYCIGGKTSSGILNRVDIYDPKTNTWEAKTTLPTARAYLFAGAIDEKIYCIGGIDSSYNATNIVEVYDTKLDTWETKASMIRKREAFGGGCVDGKIYVIGGKNNTYTNAVEEYNPETNKWTSKGTMPSLCGHMSSAVIGEKIYIMGGKASSTFDDDVFEYTPKNNSWKTKESMPTAKMGATSVVVDGKIYTLGGMSNSSSYINSLEMYDPNLNVWTTIEQNNKYSPRYDLASAVVDGKIYTIGGYYSGYTNRFEVYTTNYALIIEATNSIEKAEDTMSWEDIKKAEELINKLPESSKKNELIEKLNNMLNLVLERKVVTSNIDVYIKSENMLSMTLDTNCIDFNNFSGVEDMEKINAINISINSSLPYQLNAYLPIEIQSSIESKIMDKEILKIKESSEVNYKTFSKINEKVILKDDNPAGNNLSHSIDIMLKGGLAFEADVYKAVIKFEAEQK